MAEKRTFATGGVIRGPGSRDDDHIPAWVTNDCVLFPARVAERMREQERREAPEGDD